MINAAHSGSSPLRAITLSCLCAAALFCGCDRKPMPGIPAGPSRQNTPSSTTSPTAIAEIGRLIRPQTNTPRKDGVAAAILIDTSGSMKDTVRDANGISRPKYDIARNCLLKIVRLAEGYAKEQPNQPIVLGIYEFSLDKSDSTSFRKIVPIGAPGVDKAAKALKSVGLGGNTPIGDTIIQAKKDLDATGLSRLHILVITDGENNAGYNPADVVCALASLPDNQRPGVYFVAFDVAAATFQPAKDAGAMVLSAANEKELQEQLDFIMGNKILLEK